MLVTADVAKSRADWHIGFPAIPGCDANHGERITTMRFIRRLMFLALIVGAITAVMRRLRGGGECGPACECSNGASSCSCGHRTCLAPAQA
jgi:hypothetical protein